LSTTKIAATLIIALLLGFVGGFVAQFLMDDGNVSDLTSKVNAIDNQVGDIESRLGSFATAQDLNNLSSRVDDLDQVESTNQDQSSVPENWDQVKSDVEALKSKVNNIEATGTQTGSRPLKIGFVNATEAFTVFTGAVEDERARVSTLEQEILKLREQAIQGEITEAEYTQQNDILQAERLKAQLEIDLAMVDRMIESTGFSSIADQLKNLKSQTQPIVDQLNETLTNMRENSASPDEVSSILNQINSQYTQLDDLLTRLIESKILQVTNTLAQNQGYDMVFREQNVLLSSNNAVVDNLTDETKQVLEQEIS